MKWSNLQFSSWALTLIAVSLAALLPLSSFAQTPTPCLSTRDRDIQPNQELDTTIYAQDSGTTPFLWEIVLPAPIDGSKSYYVTLAAGDAQASMGPTRIRLSGDGGATWTDPPVVNDIETVPMEFYPVIYQEIIVYDEAPGAPGQGKLSMELGGNEAFANSINFLIINDSIEEAPPFPILIDFSNAGAAGYETENLQLYGDRGTYTYGFDSLDGLSIKDRSAENCGDPEENIFAQVTDVTRTWELEIPNGTYYVTFRCGDCKAAQGPNCVKVEGVTWIDNISTVNGEFIGVGNKIVNIFDGKLTLELGAGIDGFDSTAFNYIIVKNLRPDVTAADFPIRINFQLGRRDLAAPPKGPLSPPANFIPDIGAIFKDIYGYGWDRSRGGNAIHANVLSDRKYDTFVNTVGSENEVSWNYEMKGITAPGNYYIYMSCGDPRYSSPRQYVTLEKGEAGAEILLNGVTTAASHFEEIRNEQVGITDRAGDDNNTIDVTVTIGHDTEDSWTCLNYLVIHNEEVLPWTYPINIDFHISIRETCTGYISDIGEYFDVVRRYGWDTEGMKCDYNQSGTPPTPDQCVKESIVYPDFGQSATWKIEELAESRNYTVRMIFGDADYGSGPYTVVLQPNSGSPINLNHEYINANVFWTVTQDNVWVDSDGILEVEVGSSSPSGAAPICCMEISQQ